MLVGESMRTSAQRKFCRRDVTWKLLAAAIRYLHIHTYMMRVRENRLILTLAMYIVR